MYKQDIFIIGLIVGGLLFLQVYKWFKNRSFKKRMSKGKNAEKLAAKFLIREGYTIIDTQKIITVTTYVDGQPYKNHLRADFIVKKGFKKYIAEIKTGTMAPRVTNAATRRQLLEYYLAYKPAGIILVDMEQRKIKTVRFTFGNRIINRKTLLLFLVLIILSVVIALILYSLDY